MRGNTNKIANSAGVARSLNVGDVVYTHLKGDELYVFWGHGHTCRYVTMPASSFNRTGIPAGVPVHELVTVDKIPLIMRSCAGLV